MILFVLTNGFPKKTEKIPKEEIEVCKRRTQDYLARGSKA
ncbi:conserved hypothetical protein [uncultured spirochete]|uniref:Toxin-antitoxin system, toxin component, RelE family n=1 Tax=uncultured spirochete TaxID=156406 RepID=A0A3P3XN27_9SPIR|nr:conserved hypothetical protein [uncultured spirochete]